MTRTVTLYQFMPYGAPELQSVARQHMLRALLLSSVLYTLIFAAGGLLRAFGGSAPAAPTPVVIPFEIMPPPPPIERYRPIVPVAPATLTHTTIGVPVPAPDDQVTTPATIPDQATLSQITPGIETEERPVVVEPEATPAPKHEWETYIYVEELPEPVRTVSPEYPSLAREAGVEGTVMAHALVGRDGHVLRAEIDPEHSIPMLDEAAVRALRQWVFKPALLNSRPVEVWVAVPFRFSLH